MQHLDQVIALDRAQPEFTRAVWTYLDTAVSPQRVMRGQDKLLEVRTELDDAAAARYGVPAEIVVAIWGMESNYGTHYGDIPTIDALATLGYDGRRAAWARGQLLAALRILQNGDIARASAWSAPGPVRWGRRSSCRRTSWPMRWMPMATADATSGAAWPTSRPPPRTSCSARAGGAGRPGAWRCNCRRASTWGRADDALRQGSAQWAAEGLRGIDGAPLPRSAREASLLLPAGARGPVFLVGPNFRRHPALQQRDQLCAGGGGCWRSASAVGPACRRPGRVTCSRWHGPSCRRCSKGSTPVASTAARRTACSGLPRAGALRRYQRSLGVAADGYPTQALLRALQER